MNNSPDEGYGKFDFLRFRNGWEVVAVKVG
jgi:hypothetical protein